MTQLQNCKRRVIVKKGEAQRVKKERRKKERRLQNAHLLDDSLPVVKMPYIS
jgi:hypothetical protein